MQPAGFQRLVSYLGDGSSAGISNRSKNLLWANLVVLILSILCEIGLLALVSSSALSTAVGSDAILPTLITAVFFGPVLHIIFAIIIGIFKPANSTSTKYYGLWVFTVIAIVVWEILFFVVLLFSICVAEAHAPLCPYLPITIPFARIMYVVMYIVFYVFHRKMVIAAANITQSVAMATLHDVSGAEQDTQLII